MSVVALRETSRLDELAAKIRDEHTATCDAALTMLYHGIAAGEALLEAKAIVPRGEWESWVAANLDIHDTTVGSYMRVARHKERLLASGEVHTMQQAIWYMQENRLTTHSRTRAECLEIQAYAKQHGPRAAAKEFNVSYGTAWRYMHGNLPETRETSRIRQRLQREERKRRDEKRAVKAALRRQGRAASELYAMAEKLQDVLAQAERETETREAKAALRDAGSHYRKMRDEIVKAVLAGGRND